MPKQKDFKRLARTRMRKTGESYATARAQLLRKKNRPVPTVVPESEFASLAGMSDDAVRAKTGRTWKQWVRALDAVDAAKMAHREIASHLHESHRLPAWWSQTVTVGYERIRGLRDVGQRRGGGYEVNKCKTVPVPVAKLYAAFATARGRTRWLPGIDLTVRRSARERSMRISWTDGAPVDVSFIAKGAAKSQVTIQHRDLSSKRVADEMRAFWGERLAALAGTVASRPRR